MKERSRRHVRFGARAVLVAVALVLVAVPFSLLLFLVEDEWRPLLRIDDGARDSLHRFAVAHSGFVSAMRVLSTIGSAAVYFPLFAVVAAWLVWRGRRRVAVFVVVGVGGSEILNALVKGLVHRSRPVLPNPVAHAGGASFPSGHAQNAVVAFSVLVLVLLPVAGDGWRRRALIAPAAAMVLAIGFSRIALGVHYVSDVLAGYVLGAAWVIGVTAAFRSRSVPLRDGASAATPP